MKKDSVLCVVVWLAVMVSQHASSGDEAVRTSPQVPTFGPDCMYGKVFPLSGGENGTFSSWLVQSKTLQITLQVATFTGKPTAIITRMLLDCAATPVRSFIWGFDLTKNQTIMCCFDADFSKLCNTNYAPSCHFGRNFTYIGSTTVTGFPAHIWEAGNSGDWIYVRADTPPGDDAIVLQTSDKGGKNPQVFTTFTYVTADSLSPFLFALPPECNNAPLCTGRM